MENITFNAFIGFARPLPVFESPNMWGTFGLLGFKEASRFRQQADDTMLKQWDFNNRRLAYFPTPVFQYSSP